MATRSLINSNFWQIAIANATTGNVTGLVVTDDLQAGGNVIANGNVGAANVTATGNITANLFIGNGALLTNVAANTANVANFANYAGNVTVASQPNITTVGTLTNLAVAGNVTVGGNTTTTGVTTATGGLVSDTLTGRTGTVTITGGGTNGGIILDPAGTGNIDASGAYITNLPLTPVSPNDAATKYYVDAFLQGLKPKAAVSCSTDSALGGTYNNGAAGLGATITLVPGPITIDGYAVQTGDRVLIKDQASAEQNGVYTWDQTTGVFTRATDYDISTDMPSGAFVFDINKSIGYVQISTVSTVGTDAVTFSQQSAAISYVAGTGLQLANTTFSIAPTGVVAGTYGNANAVAQVVVNTQGQITGVSNVLIDFANANVANANFANYAGNVTVAAQSNITSLGTLVGVNVAGVSNLNNVGNVIITGGNAGEFLQTNGSGNLIWANVPVSALLANTTSNVSIPVAGGNVNTSVGGVPNVWVVTNTGANLLGNVAVTGNITGANATLSGNLQVNGNSNLGSNSNVFISGGANGQVLSTDGAGNLSWTTVNTSAVSNGTSNVSIPVIDGNVNMSVGGVANVAVITTTGANITGTLDATGNISGGNVTTGGQVVATGNVVGGNLVTAGNATVGANLTVGGISTLGPNSNVKITGGNVGEVLSTDGTGNLSWTAINTSQIANGTSNVSIPVADGNVNTSVGGVANVVVVTTTGANVAGTMTATGNVTGGNLVTAGNAIVSGNANIAGNLHATGNSILGSNANVFITGGSNGQVLTTNGTGNLSWTTINTSQIANGTSNVSIPVADGPVYTSVGGVANVVTVTTSNANVVGNINSTANVNSVNVNASGNVVATANVQANDRVITNTVQSRTGDIAITATGANGNVTLTPTGPNGNVNLGTLTYITNVQNPVNPQDAATKYYVDALAQGLKPKAAVKATTTAALTATYTNGTLGVGATLSVAAGVTTLDGYTLVAGDRVLIKDQAASAENGIYTVTSLGAPTVFTRATDDDVAAELVSGTFVFDANKAIGYVQISPDVVTVGTDSVVWSQQSAAISYTAGPGLTLANTQFFISNTGVANGNYGNANAVATFTVDDRGQLTAAGNVLIDFANANVLNANFANFAGNVTVNAQPNITSVGTLTGLTVAGISNLGPNSNVIITGGANGQVLTTDGLGNLSWAPGTASRIANVNTDISIGTANGDITGNIGSTIIPVLKLGNAMQNIALGQYAGQTNQGAVSTAIGFNAGQQNQSINSIALGYRAARFNQGPRTIAIGSDAGGNAQSEQAIAIGQNAGFESQGFKSVAIGHFAGNTAQGNYAIAIGADAGHTNQPQNSIVLNATGANYAVSPATANAFYVAPIRNANSANVLFYDATTKEVTYAAAPTGIPNAIMNGNTSVAINSANGVVEFKYADIRYGNIGNTSVSLGANAGLTTPGANTVAIGTDAGNNAQGANSVAVGANSGANTQGALSVAVGFSAGANAQGANSVAIGSGAGANVQGANSIAIGSGAGANNQHISTIVLNATGANLNTTSANGLYIAPIRNDATNTAQGLYYNTTTKEITYSTSTPTTAGAVKLPYVSWGFGRLHTFGNQVWRAGNNATNRIWGMDLGYSPQTSVELPINGTPPQSWTKTAVTQTNFIGLDAAGVLWTAGYGAYGALGNGVGTVTTRSWIDIANHSSIYGAGKVVLNFWVTESNAMGNDTNANTAVIVHINDNGVLKTFAFGYNNQGQLGTATNPVLVPLQIVALNGKSIVAACVSDYSTHLVTSTGELWSSGYNAQGGCGVGTTTQLNAFTQAQQTGAALLTNAASVAVAFEQNFGLSTAVLKTDGTVWAAGMNTGGRLGIGNTTNQTVFTQMLSAAGTPLTGITKLMGFNRGFIAFNATTGAVFFTGANADGIWGDGTAANTLGNNYAVSKQTNMENVWTSSTPWGSVPVWFLEKPDVNGVRKLWAAGNNVSWQLGVLTSAAGAIVVTKEIVPLPRDEYPTEITTLGTQTGYGAGAWGAHLVTNLGNYYVVGGTNFPTPGDIVGQGGGNGLRWFHKITDYLANASIATTSITGAPAGATGQLQYNNAGNLGGVATATFDGTAVTFGSNAAIKIGGGVGGQVLSTDGAGNLSWQTTTLPTVPPLVGATRITTAQAFTNAVATKVILNSETFDTNGAYDPTTGVFTAQIAGYYEFIVNLLFLGNGSTAMQGATVALRKNGSGTNLINTFSNQYVGATEVQIPAYGTVIVPLNAGEYIEVFATVVVAAGAVIQPSISTNMFVKWLRGL